ncbi:MAG: fibronectin type III domain-containing protein [Verrucomicrobia bacterium]|nr:fibronectin type III domain-containing protein [Verrucomicrobiota bacterium]
MLKALLKMDGMPERDKPARGQAIHDSVVGNVNFTTPNPTMANLQLAITAAQGAVVDYEAKLAVLRTALGIRNATIADLMLLLNTLAGYVSNVAQGDGAIITSAGMFVANDPQPPQPMPQPQGVRVESTDTEDSLRLLWDPIAGAKSYLVDCSASINGPWTLSTAVTAARADVESLTAGTRYYLRVRAVNGAGLGPWSDVIVKMAGV